MGTKTFLRLPEEKRKRVLDAALDEFTRVKFADASINQIIQRAGIPRGSFYQYFEDKNALFSFLLDDVRAQFMEVFRRLLDQAGGDVFLASMGVYDHCTRWSGIPNPLRDRCVRILDLNPDMDLNKMMLCWPRLELSEQLKERMDLSIFHGPPESIRLVLMMTGTVLGSAVTHSLTHPERREEYRRELEAQLEIIKIGSLRMGRAVPANA